MDAPGGDKTTPQINYNKTQNDGKNKREETRRSLEQAACSARDLSQYLRFLLLLLFDSNNSVVVVPTAAVTAAFWLLRHTLTSTPRTDY